MKINNVVIEVLNIAHGKLVIEFFKKLNINTRAYVGHCTLENKHPYRFYGVINNSFNNYSIKKDFTGIKILTLEEAIKEFKIFLNQGNFNIWF